MAEPATSFISVGSLKTLWEKLKAIRGDRKQEIHRITNEFVEPDELARYYVQPNCQHHNPADHLEDKEPRSAVKSPVFKTVSEFLEGDYAVTDGGRNQMFILSDAGMGKTSLLVMLKLTQLTRFWPQQYHCELLKLGADTLARVQALPEPGSTVLLLDALDEDPTAWGKIEQRLLELLTRTSHFRRVIISCRTQFFPETTPDKFYNEGRVTLGGFVCPMIFLSLFDNAQVLEYLNKRYPATWVHWFRPNTKREQARQLVVKMKDLHCRPMLLAHVEDLMKSTITEWTEYGVYDALVQAWLDREVRKLHKQGRHDITAGSLHRACLLVAEQMRINQSRFLTEAQIDRHMVEHPELKQITEIKFGGHSLLNRNARGDYRFSHFSIQEFLGALQVMQAGASKDRLEIPPLASEKVIRFVLDGRAKICPTKPVILRGLNLARFNLKGLDLRDCDFTDSDLSGADLTSAQLDRSVLRNTRLTGANLSGVSLTQPVEGLPFAQSLNDTVAIEFVWIPPGDFLMGERGAEQIHVTLSRGFWMGKYPVTQHQYELLTGANPSEFKKSGLDAPVERVNWDEAMAFCAKLSGRLRESGGPPTIECRLPTEAEWEYACRAGSTGRFCFGDDTFKLEAYAWYDQNSGYKTHPVGEKQPNAWGLYDMHGNVWEWCQDWHGPYPQAPVTNPIGQVKRGFRVLRGGSFNDISVNLRCSRCSSFHPDYRGNYVGFRVVCTSGSAW